MAARQGAEPLPGRHGQRCQQVKPPGPSGHTCPHSGHPRGSRIGISGRTPESRASSCPCRTSWVSGPGRGEGEEAAFSHCSVLPPLCSGGLSIKQHIYT